MRLSLRPMFYCLTVIWLMLSVSVRAEMICDLGFRLNYKPDWPQDLDQHRRNQLPHYETVELKFIEHIAMI